MFHIFPLFISNQVVTIVAIGTIYQPSCFHLLTSLVGSHWNYILFSKIMPSTVVITMGQHLEKIFALLTTPHRTIIHIQTLDTCTARHLVTAGDPPSPCHSWRVVSTSNLTKWKFSIKLPEGIEEFGLLALHALHNKNKLWKFISGILKYKTFKTIKAGYWKTSFSQYISSHIRIIIMQKRIKLQTIIYWMRFLWYLE